MNDQLFEILAEMPENRTAFLSALIMERCKVQPFQAARIAQNLVALAERIHSFAELACSREPYPHEEKRAMAAQTKFENIARLSGLIPTCGGDPRGACAYIADPSAPTEGDDMGGRGWGVYR